MNYDLLFVFCSKGILSIHEDENIVKKSMKSRYLPHVRICL